jgi:CRISPR-associated endonuclease/helicase Cas3
MKSHDNFLSHPKKTLFIHTDGVRGKTRHRCKLPIADAAALFHDLGKLNPHFQEKIKGQKPTGYDNHSYLSALAFLSFLLEGRNRFDLEFAKPGDVLAVLTLISHHHGHLPNLKKLLSKCELERLEAFVQTNPPVPASGFLGQWQPHQAFEVANPKALQWMQSLQGVSDVQLDLIHNKLEFFFETQFAFASLVEADKRDAGYNEFYGRVEQLEKAQRQFSPPLQAKLASLQPRGPLDKVRTALRAESLQKLAPLLEKGERIFSLTAPTGAGKTFMPGLTHENSL